MDRVRLNETKRFVIYHVIKNCTTMSDVQTNRKTLVQQLSVQSTLQPMRVGQLALPPNTIASRIRLQRRAVLYVFIHIYKPDDDINSWESRVFYLNHAPAYCDVWQAVPEPL